MHCVTMVTDEHSSIHIHSEHPPSTSMMHISIQVIFTAFSSAGTFWSLVQALVQFFQKFGFCARRLWKFSYQRRRQLEGTKLSKGLGVIWACVTANDAAKLYKLSNIFCVNWRKESTEETAAEETGLC
ncbi:hypothetical protein NL108_013367 [Boleophthalmus pectinirostris]|nr:hypothetical protein NL108_013367 [Boleophthalmus pectinirostris]